MLIYLIERIIKKVVLLLDKWGYFRPADFKNVPIVINNFNRLTTTKNLTEQLLQLGYKNIIILDNGSSYPLLLEWYEQMKSHICIHIIYLKENIGCLALWKSSLWRKVRRGYYAYTDSDIALNNETPVNFIEQMYYVMQKYPHIHKLGAAIRIDDIPNHNPQKNQIIEWESQYWQTEIDKDLYKAAVDTTWALYRPYLQPSISPNSNARMAGNMTITHCPWYNDPQCLSEEEIYYQTHTRTSTHWTNRK